MSTCREPPGMERQEKGYPPKPVADGKAPGWSLV